MTAQQTRFGELYTRYLSTFPAATAAHDWRKASRGRKRDFVRKRLAALCGKLEMTHLFPHQKETIRAISDHFDIPGEHMRGTVVIPTAGGKTEVFAHVIGALAKRRPLSVTVPATLVLVPTRNLLDQTKARLADGYGLDVGIWDGDRCDVRNVTLMTYALFAELATSGRIAPQDVDLLVLDEAHRGLSDLRLGALDAFLKNCICLAFSATPSFHEEKTVFDLMGRDNTVIEVEDSRLVQDGVTSPVVNYVIEVSIEGRLPPSTRDRQHILDVAGIEAMRQFAATHVDDVTGLRVGNRTFLGYTSRIAKGRLAADMLGGASAGIHAVNGKDSQSHLHALLDGIGEGSVTGLVNSMLLVEGTDLPEVSCIMNFDATSSFVREVQRCGRVRRINPRLGDRFSPEQTGFVLETYFRVNGRVIGNPIFYYEAIGEASVARLVTLDTPYRVEDLLARPGFTRLTEEDTEDAVEHDLIELQDIPASRDILPEGKRQAVAAVVSAGFRVEHRVANVFRRVRKGDLEWAPADWLGLMKVSDRLKIPMSDRTLRGAWDLMRTQVRENVEPSLGGEKVRFGTFWTTAHSVDLIHPDDLGILARHVDTPQTRYHDEEWLTRFRVAKILDCGYFCGVDRVWHHVTEAAHAGDVLVVGESEMRVSLRRGRNNTPIGYLHRDSLGAFAAVFDVVSKPRSTPIHMVSLEEALRDFPFTGSRDGLRQRWAATCDTSGDREKLLLDVDTALDLMLECSGQANARGGKIARILASL